jgi:acyl-CoA reductase-like NAD-dependent aldehyde dehydrogenase
MGTATLTPPMETAEMKSGVLESFNPATGEKLGQVPLGTPAEVRAAAERARKAQAEWWAMGVAGRNRVLKRVQQVMLDRADEIARVVSAENGKPRCEAVTMILPVAEAINYYTKLAKKFERGVKTSPTQLFTGAKARVHYYPRGVAGFIMPWNFPFELGMKHMVPALAAGNACIQKPSEFNPLIGELILGIYRQAGVPDGVVQMVYGFAEVGAALIDNVDVICFIGSPQTGKRIMARAAEKLIPVILEMGGNDAAIVRSDADIDRTARGIVTGACLNAGQTCVSVERVYAHSDVAKPLTDKIVEYASKLRQGATDYYDLGPIKWAPQREVYEAQLADAVEKGAKVLLGGQAIEEHGGVYWPPTVLTNVNHDMEIMKEETFGPFIPIMEVSGDEEALRLANDCDYGLGGSVWTQDSDAGEELARRVRAGSVMVNGAAASAGCPTLPFGGDGLSGVGRALGEMGYINYTSPRSIMRMPGGPLGKLGWMPYGKKSESFMVAMAKVLYSDSVGKKIGGLSGLLRALLGK